MYALHVETIERQVLADRHVAAVFMAAGARSVELPTLAEALDEFDRALVQEAVPTEQDEMLRLLGVA